MWINHEMGLNFFRTEQQIFHLYSLLSLKPYATCVGYDTKKLKRKSFMNW